mmetsp:Transcript_61351/g.168510  ORF Transcript_61351/g.168510 Transcript_61351/m.168510 type:complete len:301 (+) Transcript_61351:1370-2272(+)
MRAPTPPAASSCAAASLAATGARSPSGRWPLATSTPRRRRSTSPRRRSRGGAASAARPSARSGVGLKCCAPCGRLTTRASRRRSRASRRGSRKTPAHCRWPSCCEATVRRWRARWARGRAPPARWRPKWMEVRRAWRTPRLLTATSGATRRPPHGSAGSPSTWRCCSPWARDVRPRPRASASCGAKRSARRRWGACRRRDVPPRSGERLPPRRSMTGRSSSISPRRARVAPRHAPARCPPCSAPRGSSRASTTRSVDGRGSERWLTSHRAFGSRCRRRRRTRTKGATYGAYRPQRRRTSC